MGGRALWIAIMLAERGYRIAWLALAAALAISVINVRLPPFTRIPGRATPSAWSARPCATSSSIPPGESACPVAADHLGRAAGTPRQAPR